MGGGREGRKTRGGRDGVVWDVMRAGSVAWCVVRFVCVVCVECVRFISSVSRL